MTPEMIATCERHAVDVMAAAFPAVPVYRSGEAIPKEVSVYVLFYVVPSDEVFKTGISENSKSRNVGLLQANVRGPKDQGAGYVGDIAMALARGFQRFPIEVGSEGWCVCREAATKDMGDDEEEHEYMMRVPYRYDFVFPT